MLKLKIKIKDNLKVQKIKMRNFWNSPTQEKIYIALLSHCPNANHQEGNKFEVQTQDLATLLRLRTLALSIALAMMLASSFYFFEKWHLWVESSWLWLDFIS